MACEVWSGVLRCVCVGMCVCVCVCVGWAPVRKNDLDRLDIADSLAIQHGLRPEIFAASSGWPGSLLCSAHPASGMERSGAESGGE